MCDIAEAIRAVGRVQKHEVAVQQANIGRWTVMCAASVLVGVVLTGCNSSTGTDTPSGRIPTSLVMGAGVDGQVANVGSAVPTLPSVTVRDQDGRPLPGAVVLWAVRSGGGTVGFSSSAADSLGRASTSWVLGRTAGTQVLAALLTTGDSLRINATAHSPPRSSCGRRMCISIRSPMPSCAGRPRPVCSRRTVCGPRRLARPPFG
jgi:hypothetical protein